jgi:hypothetical protein
MDLSLSRSTSLSEEEQLPVENVEFAMTLGDHDDLEGQVSKPRPVTAAVVRNDKNRKHHVRQQSGGSSIGSVDSLEAEETTVPIMSAAAAQQQQLYWQQWQQYYATYGYPHYSATATEGYSPAQHQQPPHQVDYQLPYDVIEHHRRASDPMGGSTMPAYGSNMYPLSNQPQQQTQPRNPQQWQRQQGLLVQQQQPQQQYTPSWSTNYAQGTPPSTPAQSNFPVPYERTGSSSNPGISYTGGAGGGAATAKNNSNHRTVGISLRTDQQHDEVSPLQLGVTPKSSNYGTALSGSSNNNNNKSRAPKMVHHHNRSQSLGRGSIDAAGRHLQRSNSDVQTSRNGGGDGSGNNAIPASRSGLAPSLPRPAQPMRLSSSKKRLDNTPPPSSRPGAVGGGGRHRRNSSLASTGGLSVSSMVSVVSDIRKSGTYT